MTELKLLSSLTTEDKIKELLNSFSLIRTHFIKYTGEVFFIYLKAVNMKGPWFVTNDDVLFQTLKYLKFWIQIMKFQYLISYAITETSSMMKCICLW